MYDFGNVYRNLNKMISLDNDFGYLSFTLCVCLIIKYLLTQMINRREHKRNRNMVPCGMTLAMFIEI